MKITLKLFAIDGCFTHYTKKTQLIGAPYATYAYSICFKLNIQVLKR